MPQTVPVVTVFLRHEGRLLLLRRSDRVGSYRGHWAAVSGYLEEPTALAQALREVREETGLEAAELILAGTGAPFAVEDAGLDRRWVVHPFLFDVVTPPAIRLDWEHSEFRWVAPGALRDLPTVPQLAEALAACWPAALAGETEDRAE